MQAHPAPPLVQSCYMCVCRLYDCSMLMSSLTPLLSFTMWCVHRTTNNVRNSRICGKNCCSSCSPRRRVVAGYAAPERICNTCETGSTFSVCVVLRLTRCLQFFADVPLSRSHQYNDDVVLKRSELLLLDTQRVFKRVTGALVSSRVVARDSYVTVCRCGAQFGVCAVIFVSESAL